MTIRLILRRDLLAQFAVSRNLKESWWTWVRRVFWAIVYLCHGIVVGLRGTRTEQLGEYVMHKGKRRIISNWAGSAYPTLAGDGFYEQNVPRSEITPIRGQWWHRFCFMFGWYMSSWHGIDVNKKVHPEAYLRTDEQ